MATNTFTFEEALQPQESETFSFEDALGTPPTPEADPQSPFRQVADVPVGVAIGGARGVRGLVDVFGADNPVSKSIQGVEKYLDGLLSAQAKDNQQEIGRIMKEAEDKGALEQVKSAWQAFLTAPIDLMSQALGTAAPTILGGLGARVLGAGVTGVRAVAGATGAGMGAGIVKGEIYEAVEEGLKNAGVSEEQAQQLAQEAQSYGGENLDQIALASLLGFAGARVGIESALIPGLTGKISAQLAKKGFGKFAQTVTGEALTEAAQGGQERYATNVAQQGVGLDVPTWQGVPGAMMLEGITGGGVGTGVGMVGPRADREKKIPPTQTERDLQALREEQRTADYMRQVETAEAEERARLESLAQTRTAEEAQTKIEELASRVGAIEIGAENLESTLDTLYNAKDDLTLIKDGLTRSAGTTDVRKSLNAQLDAVNARIKEGQALAKTIGLEPKRRAALTKEQLAQLPPEQRAAASAAVFDTAGQQGVLRAVGDQQVAPTEATTPTNTVLGRQDLLDAGLPATAAYVKQLSGLDLANPDQRTQAAEIIGRAIENPRVPDAAKQNLQALYNEKLAQPAPEGQRALDFDTAPEAGPSTIIDQSTFDDLGIGKTAVLRRSADVLGKDMSDPVQREFVRNVLETYRDAPNRSDSIIDKINDYLAQFPPIETAPEVTPEVTPDVPVGAADVEPTITPPPSAPPTVEPTVERPAGEPSVDVAGMGDGSAPAPEGAPAGVPETTVGGLADTAGGVAGDPRGAQRAAPEPATVESDLAGDALVQLARKPDLSMEDVQAEAVNAQIEGRISREDAQMVVRSDTAEEALTTLEIAIEQGRNDVVRAVDTLRALGDSAGAVTPALTRALTAQDPQAALTTIVDDDSGVFNEREKLVARRILDMRTPLPTMRMVDSLGVDGNGDPILGQYDAVSDGISLVRGAADSHTFLHEMIHAFVHRTIITQERDGARNPQFRTLQEVYNHVLETRPDLNKEYGLSSLTEFASEVMSNRDFQLQLMGMPYRAESVFTWFAKAIRDLLGIPESSVEGNVLFTAMVAVDGLMRTGRDLQRATIGQKFNQFNIAYAVQNVDTPPGKPLPSTFAEVDTAADPVYRSEWRKFVNTVAQAEIPLMDIFRQQAFDILAPIASKVTNAFSQGVRSAFGDVNPMVWLRQAFDHQRVSLQVFNRGGIRINKDGQWEAFDLKDGTGNAVSPKMVIEKIQAFAEKQGMSYAQTKARLGTLLESMRLKELRDHNAKIEALARQKALEGDIDGAYETRLDKILLHKTNAQIDADVAIFNKTPEAQEIQKMLNTVRSNMIDAMVASGRISKERAQGWKEAVNYVPFDRLQDVMENPDVIFTPTRKGLAVLSKLPEIRGSLERPVSNVIDNYMNKIAWMTEQSMRNSAVVRVLDFMVDAGMARRIQSPSEANNANYIIPKIYKDGQPVLYEVQNRYDLAAFVQSPELNGSFIKALGGASRLLRTTITATPMFSIKQVIDDSQRVIFNSGVKRPLAALGKTLYYFPRVWWSQAFGKDFKYMRQMEALGIAGEFDYNPINPLSTLEADTGVVPRSPVRALIHRMEQIARASDMAARLAVYEQTMQESNDPLLAQQRARELINFNRRGASKTMRAITHVVPFFNSYVQGLDLMYRGMTGTDAPSGLPASQARRMFMSRVMMMAALATIYAMAMSDDEYYKEIGDDTRDRNWILPKAISDGLGLKQPMKFSVPNEFGFFFKSIPERTVQYFKEAQTGSQKQASEAFMDAVKAIGGEYAMMPIPAAIRPIMENTVNYSTFTQRPLLTPSMKDRPAAMQYTSATSEIAKALGKATNTSPILIDNYIRGYFGMAGGAISVVADSLMNPARPDRGPEQIPFLSIGMVAPVGRRTTDEFYDFREKVTEAVSGLNFLKDKDPKDYEAFLRKNESLLSVAPYVNNYVRQLTRIRDVRKAYETDTEMTGAEKREALLELRRVEQEVLKDFRELRAMTYKK